MIDVWSKGALDTERGSTHGETTMAGRSLLSHHILFLVRPSRSPSAGPLESDRRLPLVTEQSLAGASVSTVPAPIATLVAAVVAS